ncbi:Ldh family oxidoreductase [Tundrisphaera sp. TA3]|uniref:Ldh family oxidoreductase n=1 Tax=Tundrisphaera sp. TA3 TaxID=3435775 RepID=UPI003EBDBA49
MGAGVAERYRLDDLRRIAADLAKQAGVAPARASALATHLLWFDAAGVPAHGIGTLPEWLDRIDSGEIDPRAEGKARGERAGTAVFDAGAGLPPLILARAAEIATEKARELGIGMVRVVNLGRGGSAAPVAAEMAMGPFAATIVGPGPTWTVALPMPEGLPALYDSALIPDGGRPADPGIWPAWASAIAGEEGWAILALAVPALESLSSFHERVSASFRGGSGGEGLLLPGPWDDRRREARERGVALDGPALVQLRDRADRLGLAFPLPIRG